MKNIFIGTAGWSYPDWAGAVYPLQRPRGFSELSYLAQYLDAVEINMSFYRPPRPAMAEKWLRQVAKKPGFLFTAKLWERFTHERDKPWTAAEVGEFKAGLEPLAEAGRLGALLLQFPWSFRADPASHDWLSRLADEFREFPKVVEVRHASWGSEENWEFLRSRGLNFCNIDQPRVGASLGMTNVATGPIAYYRFHGRNREAWFAKDAGRDERYNYLYSTAELAPWVEDILFMAQRVEKLFVMNNNHYRGQAVVNALQMKSSLARRKVPAPAELLEHYPVLKEVAATPKGASGLF